MVRNKLIVLGGLSALVVACSPTTAPVGVPTSATVNGYTFADKTAGKVNFNVSALDSSNKVLTSGTLSEPTASGVAVAATGTTVTPSICGQIQGQSGVLKAAIVLDSTGSMAVNDPASTAGDLTTTKRNQAGKTFISRMGAADSAAVASFDATTPPTAPYLAINLTQNFTSDKALLNSGVNLATRQAGTTNLWDAVFDSADLLGAQTGGNKVALVMTDGVDNASTKVAADAISNAKAKGVHVYMVGLGSSLNATAMQQVAAETGGLYATASQAAQLTGLFNGMFNATQAAGCIQLAFDPVPTTGQKVTGTVGFKVNGVALSAPFDVQF
jgi:Ca-activated chloride channel homolog